MPDGPQRLFLFVQCEFPWALGPADGRYLLRSETDGEPERVVVLATLPAARAPLGADAGILRRRAARARAVAPEPEPTPVLTARATIVDPVSLSAERQAQAWLSELDSEREVSGAFAVLNRVLHAQRVASADPYAREVSPEQALTLRVGWGEGEQVADGRWLHAVELPWGKPLKRKHRRATTLRVDERLARLLAARERPLQCEEHTLRARLDLDQGRLAHGAAELQLAYAMALPELREENRQDLAIRIAELEQLRGPVSAQARAALPGSSKTPEEEVVRHALERLEAALRARTAAGF
ncbi:MAG TPA: hypothetical protein VGL68_07185 [Solirubrobacteraceae bacterium]